MARLQRRSVGWTSRAYLTYRALWPAIEREVAAALTALGHGVDDAAPVVIDVGCGARPYADLFAHTRYVGLNLDAIDASPDVIGDAAELPFADAAADLVFCTQVLEHVPDPARVVGEMHRILKRGGALVLTAPFYWPLHEEPHDFFRFTAYGLRHLLAKHGFECLEIRPDTGALTQVAVSVIELLPRWAGVLVPLINAATPVLQRLSRDRRSTLNHVVRARKP
jgi:SAM-dependent methyltransferase